MLFNSIEFALFLPIVFLLYWFVFDYALRRCHLFFLRDVCTPTSNIKTQSHAKKMNKLRTLRNWLQNPKAQHILQKYGHKQTDRILCPGAVRELCEYFDIQFD